jgi:hypothetical protein
MPVILLDNVTHAHPYDREPKRKVVIDVYVCISLDFTYRSLFRRSWSRSFDGSFERSDEPAFRADLPYATGPWHGDQVFCRFAAGVAT